MSSAPGTLILYHTPGTCSRVTMAALEELKLTFEDRPIDIFKGAQHRDDYQAINPRSKVPALVIGDEVLTETPAIIRWLTDVVPGEALLPGAQPLARSQAFADLVWCSNTLHPLARTIRMPQRATAGDPGPVQEAAVAQALPVFELIGARLANRPWWFGERWSIVDVYLSWVVDMCEGGNMPLAHLDSLRAHRSRVRERPGFRRTLEREERALKEADISLPGDGRL